MSVTVRLTFRASTTALAASDPMALAVTRRSELDGSGTPRTFDFVLHHFHSHCQTHRTDTDVSVFRETHVFRIIWFSKKNHQPAPSLLLVGVRLTPENPNFIFAMLPNLLFPIFVLGLQKKRESVIWVLDGGRRGPPGFSRKGRGGGGVIRPPPLADGVRPPPTTVVYLLGEKTERDFMKVIE